MREGKSFLRAVWSLQPQGWATLVYRPEAEEWREYHFRYPQDWDKVAALPMDGDLYFCPNLFGRRERKKESCLPSRVMYQDLDYIHPSESPILPTWWWETSPGRYQALWIVDQFLEPDEHAAYNRALNRLCGADQGTWNLTRVLRVPGSFNLKRGCRVSPAYREVPKKEEVA